jgi:cyclophilin family peptidyl-prolyl cis-trans isomerase
VFRVVSIKTRAAALKTKAAAIIVATAAALSWPVAVSQAQDPLPGPGDLQAVVETTAGTFVMEFYADEAPAHVDHFFRLFEEGFYDGTTFHSMFERGIVQAGDPLTRDPDNRDEYGTGGFHMNLEPEFSGIEFTAGTVVATLLPGDSSSAGSQFFICVGDQPQFTGQFTAFGRVVEGLDVVDRISATPVDDKQIATERVEILGISLRPIPPPPVTPFTTETDEELADFRAVLETAFGEITIGVRPDAAPHTVRHFLRLAAMGVYDQTAFHRVAPGFVIQGGDLNTRIGMYAQEAREHVVEIDAELSDIPHVAGIVSMARGEEIDSALTSFFIVLSEQPVLDGVYTVFGEVVDGMDVVEAIAAVETNQETPVERVDVYAVRVERIN